jgi:hypothetical protein
VKRKQRRVRGGRFTIWFSDRRLLEEGKKMQAGATAISLYWAPHYSWQISASIGYSSLPYRRMVSFMKQLQLGSQ